MKQLTDMRYDNVGGVREFIMKMVHIQTKLKSQKIYLNEKFIVEHTLNFLPADFTQIKTTHNTIGQNWIANDLITKCVVEEEKLKKEKSDISLLFVKMFSIIYKKITKIYNVPHYLSQYTILLFIV